MRRLLPFSVTVSIFSFGFFAAINASGMPEEQMKVERAQPIEQALLSNAPFAVAQQKFSLTGIQKLDDLWKSARTMISGACTKTQKNCRVISVFQGHYSSHPVVLLPGFTGYRQMYIEQISDLIEDGYGPIYISDFTGTGESYKPELNPGQSLPKVSDIIGTDIAAEKVFTRHVTDVVGDKNSEAIKGRLKQFPIGIGYVPDFHDYVIDVNTIMLLASRENQGHKILVSSLSMSGMNLLEALAEQNQNKDERKNWIKNVDRIVFESPMIRIKGANPLGVPGVAGSLRLVAKVKSDLTSQNLILAAASIPEFVDKALGHYNEKNMISHSANRLTLTDSLRIWNGHETFGATWGWAYEELKHQYALGPLELVSPLAEPLNFKEDAIRDVLLKNKVGVVFVGSEGDGVVDTDSLKMFVEDLGASGSLDLNLCLFKTARHVIDQESDFYRVPYMQLLHDQQTHTLKSSYGREPVNERLKCQTVTDSRVSNWD